MAKILIVDDEPNIVEVIRLYLVHSGFTPIMLYSGSKVLKTIQEEQPELVILDIMLPDMTGFKLCEQIRGLTTSSAQTPIILLTAKGEAIDKLKGFNLGVDDYIVKPFDPNELIARMKAVLRRSQGNLEGLDSRNQANGERPNLHKKMLDFSSLTIDLDQYKVIIHGSKADLTPKEIELLYFLASHPGRVYTREDLLKHVWQFDFAGGTRTVDAHIKNLRKKLGSHEDWNIQTLWGIGYAFEVTAHA
ncbi:MAG: response regulator transcription factor [Paenibacillaceae bacterium]